MADLGQPISNQSLLVAAKIVLPGFPAVSIWIGLAFLFGDPSRYTSPSLDVAKDIMPIRTWGVLFLLVGAIELSALIFGGNRFWFSAALAIGAAMRALGLGSSELRLSRQLRQATLGRFTDRIVLR